MNIFDGFDADMKRKLVVIWKSMSAEDRDHFINQMALSLSVWGSDDRGTKIAVELVKNLLEDGSKNLADFGLYLEYLDERMLSSKEQKYKKAMNMLDDYRFKHALPSEPAKEFV